VHENIIAFHGHMMRRSLEVDNSERIDEADIPGRSNRRMQIDHRALYKQRNRIA